MIIRALTIEGFGCFAEKADVGPFGAGVNILYGPNGVGKSTVSRAITSALLDGHRVKAAEMKAVRPWGRRLGPRVMLEIENGGRAYRIRKQFLDAPSSSVYRQEGGVWKPFMANDDADDFLRTLLKCTPPGSGIAQPKHWGLAQILWTTQGDLTIPPLADGIVESIQQSVGAQLTAGGSAAERKIFERYNEFYQPKLANLKRNAPARTLADERARLAQEVATAEEMLALWDSEAVRIEELRIQVAAALADRERRESSLKAARNGAQIYARLTSDKAERFQRKRAAESEYGQIREQIERIQRCREQIRINTEESHNLNTGLPQTEARLSVASAAFIVAEQQFQRVQEEDRDVEAAVIIAKTAAEYIRDLQRAASLERRIQSASEAIAEIESIRSRQRCIVAPTDADVRSLRRTIDVERDARRSLELARVNVTIEASAAGEITVSEGNAPGIIAIANGSIIEIAGAPNVTFAIPGFGRLSVAGPASDYVFLQEQREKCLAELDQFVVRFGTSDAEQLESLRRQAEKVEIVLSQTLARTAEALGGQTVEMLRAERADIQIGLDSTESRYPQWVHERPNVDALELTAARRSDENRRAYADAYTVLIAEQQAKQQATAALEGLKTRSRTLKQNIEDATRDLSLCCGDQTDEDRLRMQKKAAIEYDACTEALGEAEKQLMSFPTDPADQFSDLERDFAETETLVQNRRDALLRSETRVSEMSRKALYSEYGALSDRLSAVEAEATREQLKMDALALLRNTLLQAKDQLLTAVSKPVEERATSYLERICAKPLASIRLTHDFAAETVIPAELESCSDNAINIGCLSGGEKEQIWLCTRIALAMELAREEGQFLLLDDILTSTDDVRMSRICDLLAELAGRMQVIVFTCHPERFARISNANLIDVGAHGAPQHGINNVAA
jgi:ABC-type hemin transport system ATPase subunit